MKAESIRVDQAQPLPVEMLLTPDQRRTSRTAPDETEAILSEFHRIEAKRKPTL